MNTQGLHQERDPLNSSKSSDKILDHIRMTLFLMIFLFYFSMILSAISLGYR